MTVSSKEVELKPGETQTIVIQTPVNDRLKKWSTALLNKPPKEVSDKWDKRLVELALSSRQYDTTRDFMTLDGDRDMDGQLPVWSKHFAHGLKLEDLPQNPDKPLIVA